MQNLAPAGFSAPQLGHRGVRSVPHDMQKRARSGFSAAHLGQVLPSIKMRIRPSTGAPAKDLALPCGALFTRGCSAGATRLMPKEISIYARGALSLVLVAALLLAACGGGGVNDEDPQQVLTQTFSNPTPIKSGNFDLDFKIEANGGDSPGTLEVKLGGQFQNQAPGQFPQFDFDVSLRAESGSQTFSGSGGLTGTGDRAFVNIQGTEYAVPQQLYDRVTSTYAQLQSQNGSNPQAGLLQRLNIDLAKWLTDLKNEGTEDVEGQKTIHISGKANVSQIVDDLKRIAKDAGRSVGNVDLSQLDQLNNTIQSGDVNVNTGE